MLTCIFHPVYPMRTVEEHTAEELMASGFWFDSPVKAKEYREKLETEIKEEDKIEKSKAKTIKGKSK